MTTPAPPERPELDERAPIFDPELDEPTPRPFGGVDPLRHGRDAATAVPFPEAQGEPDERQAVDVRIVSDVSPPRKRRRFTTQNYYIDPNSNGVKAIPVLGHRQNRTKATFVYKRPLGFGAPGRLWLSQDENPNASNGFPLEENERLDLNTTEDLWAQLDPQTTNPGLLCVITEYETDIEEFVPGDKHPHKGGLFDRFFGDRETRL